jgi:hypothetical protein
MSQPPTGEESDLDSTAELPVLDPAGLQPAEGEHSNTDTWAALPQLRHEHDLPPEATLEAVSVELRAAHQRLTSQAERLAQLEKDREQIRAGRLAAEQLVTTLSAELARVEAAAAQHAAQTEQLTQGRLAAEQRDAAATQELMQLQSGGDADAARQLAGQRAAAEQRASALDAELARLRGAALQHASQFAELTGARAAAELRVRRLEEELQALRAEHEAAVQRNTQLQERVEEHEKTQQAAQARQLQEEHARAERDRLHAAHAASIMVDLHAERARAMTYFESLQTLEGGRSIFRGAGDGPAPRGAGARRRSWRVPQELGEREVRMLSRRPSSPSAPHIAVLEQQVILIWCRAGRARHAAALTAGASRRGCTQHAAAGAGRGGRRAGARVAGRAGAAHHNPIAAQERA